MVFADASAAMQDDNTIVLTYLPENRFRKENAQEKQYTDFLKQALKKHFGRDMRILFRIEHGDDSPEQEPDPEPEVQPDAPAEPAAQNLSLFDQVNQVFPNSREIE